MAQHHKFWELCSLWDLHDVHIKLGGAHNFITNYKLSTLLVSIHGYESEGRLQSY
jgi:hypothetical protein